MTRETMFNNLHTFLGDRKKIKKIKGVKSPTPILDASIFKLINKLSEKNE